MLTGYWTIIEITVGKYVGQKAATGRAVGVTFCRTCGWFSTAIVLIKVFPGTCAFALVKRGPVCSLLGIGCGGGRAMGTREKMIPQWGSWLDVTSGPVGYGDKIMTMRGCGEVWGDFGERGTKEGGAIG